MVIDRATLALAHHLADTAAAITRHWFRRSHTQFKSDRSPVTQADLAVEQALRAILARSRPDDAIIGEEFGGQLPSNGACWVLDPIDGTKAFATGRPLFVTLIALLIDGHPVLGIIDQPILGERWCGAVGHPARRNGRPVRTRPCAALSRAWLSATAPDMFRGGDARGFARLDGRCASRVWGGDGYAYGLLASGYLDLVVEADLKPHDIAALMPVVAGAGGVVLDWQGAPANPLGDGRIIAAGAAGLGRQAAMLLRA